MAAAKNPRRIHDVVSTRIAVLATTAQARVAALESSERQTPVLSGTSNTRLTIARRITESRAISESWTDVLRYVTDAAPAGATPAAVPAGEDVLSRDVLEEALAAAFGGAPRTGAYAEGWNDAIGYLRTVLKGR